MPKSVVDILKEIVKIHKELGERLDRIEAHQQTFDSLNETEKITWKARVIIILDTHAEFGKKPLTAGQIKTFAVTMFPDACRGISVHGAVGSALHQLRHNPLPNSRFRYRKKTKELVHWTVE